jgi:hypothetical protein
MAKLVQTTVIRDDSGTSHTFYEGDEPPPWAAARILNPKAWEGKVLPDPEGQPESVKHPDPSAPRKPVREKPVKTPKDKEAEALATDATAALADGAPAGTVPDAPEAAPEAQATEATQALATPTQSTEGPAEGTSEVEGGTGADRNDGPAPSLSTLTVAELDKMIDEHKLPVAKSLTPKAAKVAAIEAAL